MVGAVVHRQRRGLGVAIRVRWPLQQRTSVRVHGEPPVDRRNLAAHRNFTHANRRTQGNRSEHCHAGRGPRHARNPAPKPPPLHPRKSARQTKPCKPRHPEAGEASESYGGPYVAKPGHDGRHPLVSQTSRSPGQHEPRDNHPRELDPAPPHLPLSLKERFIQDFGHARGRRKIERLLRHRGWAAVSEVFGAAA